MTEPSSTDWRPTLKRRIAVAAGLFLLWSAGIEARLIYLQVYQHEELSAQAERQRSRTVTTPARRGDIVDRDQHLLAYSVDADSVYSVPSEIGDAEAHADALCEALGDCSQEERLTLVGRFSRDTSFAYVRRHVTPDQARRIAALELQGIGFMKESRRYYPGRELAAHLLGYVGTDGDGLSGVELEFDSLIGGQDGQMLIQVDARRQPFGRVETSPTAGATLELSIDQYLQHVAERELEAGIRENKAAAGTVIIMEPRTGEVLAMANWPTFNPNASALSSTDVLRNRAVEDLYEPGSTFKIVTASAAIETGVVRPGDIIDVSSGEINFGPRVVRDTRDYGRLSFTDVLVMSSNVGAIKVGQKLGSVGLNDYIRRFGFGRKSSPDFRMESHGIVWDPAELTPSALASVSMGYQIGVTPIQMAAAVSAIASGGERAEPRVVRAVIRGDQRSPVEWAPTFSAINPETAATLTAIMEQVVLRGTGTTAAVPGYRTAGKTGTAKKLIDGSYQGHSEYNASFVGFVPARNPAFSIVVVIDSPHGPNGFYGGPVAGSIFSRIANAALRHHGVPPTNGLPPVLVALEADAPEAIDPIVTQVVAPMDGDPHRAPPSVPELRGASVRRAVRTLGALGMEVRLAGDGNIVMAQQPVPGTAVAPGMASTIWLGRSVPQSPSDDAAE